MKNKYSDWLKIDLHIHTDWSKKTKDSDYKGVFSVDTLKSKLKENNVELFSLTDHNIINIDAYNEYYENYNEDEDPLLLLGIELDISVINPTGDTKTYHSLLIFNYFSTSKTNEISLKIENKYAEKGLDDKKRILTIDEVIELFPEDDFFFIPHAGNQKSIISGYRENIEDAQKMVLLMQSAFEKVPEKARQKYNEGFNKVLIDAFKNKDDIPYIEFSDNHNIEKYPCTHKGDADKIHNFYRIKGSKNYETLRLAFIDPKSRIISSKEYEKIIQPFNYIDKIRIEYNDYLEDNELSFSPHLNVVIGGRSSGKSLLFNILGHKITSVNVKEKYKINKDGIKIKSKNDADFLYETTLTNQLIYLNQGDIVKYFEENKLLELAKEAGKKDAYEQALDLFDNHKEALSNRIKKFINSYKNVFEIGEDKKYLLHNSIIKHILSEDFIFKMEYDTLLRKYDLSKDIEDSERIVTVLIENTQTFKKIELLKFTPDEDKVIEDFERLLKIKSDLVKEIKLRNEKIIKFINNVNTLISERNQGLTIEAREKDDANRTLKKLKEDISEKFKALATLKNRCTEFELFDYTKKEKVDLNNNISLILEIEKEEDLKSIILDGFNNSNENKTLYINVLYLLDKKCSIKNYPDDLSPETLEKKIDKQFEFITAKIDKPLDYLEYNDGTTSRDNSPGYNSEKYLEIILKNPDNKLIFIDQPEDNLGNHFIAKRLVSMIRDLKFQKQFFLVTHNPSIVVYGDAESIIIANNESNTISYNQIVLENQSSQKEICGILDGGEYIFDNRSKKYNIKRILRGE